MNNKIVVGWREYVSLPTLGIDNIKAKVDTGARTSCLHAFKSEHFEQDSQTWVRFWLHPVQNDQDTVIVCEAPVIDQRIIRDSGGHEEYRDIIQTDLSIGGKVWPIEITLSNRENMRFRMLLGRTAMNHRIIVDPSLSFLMAEERKN